MFLTCFAEGRSVQCERGFSVNRWCNVSLQNWIKTQLRCRPLAEVVSVLLLLRQLTPVYRDMRVDMLRLVTFWSTSDAMLYLIYSSASRNAAAATTRQYWFSISGASTVKVGLRDNYLTAVIEAVATLTFDIRYYDCYRISTVGHHMHSSSMTSHAWRTVISCLPRWI